MKLSEYSAWYLFCCVLLSGLSIFSLQAPKPKKPPRQFGGNVAALEAQNKGSSPHERKAANSEDADEENSNKSKKPKPRAGASKPTPAPKPAAQPETQEEKVQRVKTLQALRTKTLNKKWSIPEDKAVEAASTIQRAWRAKLDRIRHQKLVEEQLKPPTASLNPTKKPKPPTPAHDEAEVDSETAPLLAHGHTADAASGDEEGPESLHSEHESAILEHQAQIADLEASIDELKDSQKSSKKKVAAKVGAAAITLGGIGTALGMIGYQDFNSNSRLSNTSALAGNNAQSIYANNQDIKYVAALDHLLSDSLAATNGVVNANNAALNNAATGLGATNALAAAAQQNATRAQQGVKDVQTNVGTVENNVELVNRGLAAPKTLSTPTTLPPTDTTSVTPPATPH